MLSFNSTRFIRLVPSQVHVGGVQPSEMPPARTAAALVRVQMKRSLSAKSLNLLQFNTAEKHQRAFCKVRAG